MKTPICRPNTIVAKTPSRGMRPSISRKLAKFIGNWNYYAMAQIRNEDLSKRFDCNWRDDYELHDKKQEFIGFERYYGRKD